MGLPLLFVSMGSRFQWSLADYAVSVASSLLTCGGAMELRVHSQGSGMDFRVPVMILSA